MHTIVGDDHHLEGDAGAADVISPMELPPCDVLEMDCEGAETAILSELEIQPRTIIVEAHWNINEIKSNLAELGYSIVSEMLAETGPYESI